MAYEDRRAVRAERYRINLNQYQADAIEALARLNRKQPATYLSEIIETYLEAYAAEPERMLRKKA